MQFIFLKLLFQRGKSQCYDVKKTKSNSVRFQLLYLVTETFKVIQSLSTYNPSLHGQHYRGLFSTTFGKMLSIRHDK